MRWLGWLGVALWVAGCTDGDVRLVKDSVWNAMPDTTIGKALDTRQACAKTEWRAFDDDRERRIVEYRCEYRDARAHFEKSTQQQIQAHQKDGAFQIEHLQAMLATERERLQQQQARVDERARLAESSRQDEGEEFFRSWMTADLERLTRMADCRDFRIEALRGHGDLGDLQAAAAACTRGEAWAMAAYPRLHAGRITQLKRNLAELQGRERSSLADLQVGQEWEQQQLAELQAEVQKMEAELGPEQERARAETAARVALATARLEDFQHVHEITQWSVVHGSVVHVASVVEIQFRGQQYRGNLGEKGVILQAQANADGLSPWAVLVLDSLWPQYKLPDKGAIKL